MAVSRQSGRIFWQNQMDEKIGEKWRSGKCLDDSDASHVKYSDKNVMN